MDWEARDTECHRLLANSVWSSNSKILEVQDFRWSGAVACTPGDKEAVGLGANKLHPFSLGLHKKRMFPFLLYI